jgi:hypothetical protein
MESINLRSKAELEKRARKKHERIGKRGEHKRTVLKSDG